MCAAWLAAEIALAALLDPKSSSWLLKRKEFSVSVSKETFNFRYEMDGETGKTILEYFTNMSPRKTFEQWLEARNQSETFLKHRTGLFRLRQVYGANDQLSSSELTC